MALNELMETFEFLKKQIDEHGPYLKADETRTRQVLIDPLLEELGWDVTNPTQVELEYRIDKPFEAKGQKKPDYALMPQGLDNPDEDAKPVCVIEAKSLDGGKLDEATTQVHDYAFNRGVAYGISTDGDEWRLVDVYQRQPLQQKTEKLFQITIDSASACALKALALWNPNLCANGGPIPAEDPVLVTVVGPPPPPPDWHPLPGVPTDRTPTGIKFGDGPKVKISSWTQLWVQVATHLVETGKIRATDLPVKVAGGKNCVINNKPHQPDGRPFPGRPNEIADGFWLYTVFNKNGFVANSQKLLEDFHVAPATVQVCFD